MKPEGTDTPRAAAPVGSCSMNAGVSTGLEGRLGPITLLQKSPLKSELLSECGFQHAHNLSDPLHC